MKKIDWFLIRSFIPPFLATFFIALFVLVLQFFWHYIDDILGKGITFFYFLEFLFYSSLTFLPLALPIAVLLSSVMVMGNMAEHHELTTLKSAGVSLARTMRPLILICFLIACLSFFANNNLIPFANLKKYSRLYDLKKSKPTMSLESGVFNDDFSDINIYIEDKDKDNGNLYGVKIYDHNNAQKYSLITADSGYMLMDEGNNLMMMKLFSGYQYQEEEPGRGSSSRRFPYVRTKFSSWQRYLDLSEFEVDNTDEDLFKGNQKIMKAGELYRANDSLLLDMENRKDEFANYVSHFIHKDFIPVNQRDSTIQSRNKLSESDKASKPSTIFRLQYNILDSAIEATNFLDLFSFNDRKTLINKSISKSNTLVSHAETTDKVWFYKEEKIVKIVSTFHNKFSLAFTCLLFLFIGAPMGAIIRKGGFGYPILVAIVFFVAYIILSTYYRKLAESFQMDAALAAWMPVFVLLPIGFFLTFKAMNDSKLLNINIDFSKIASLFRRRKNEV